jgi:P27 family predicted phage terminase small subunit
MVGRKPKPTHLKVVLGNPGKRRLNASEPMPLGDLFEPPAHLNDRQRRVWSEAIAAAPGGLLKRLDGSVLLVWVVAADLHAMATTEVEKYGAVIAAPKTEMPMQSPWVAVMNRQALLMLRASAEMGFTPASRSRINVNGGQKAEKSDPADGYF